MKKLLLFLFCIPFLGIAQNLHTINTVGNTFSPASLVINLGDTVIWNNTQGFHNINATLATYPINPQGFGNIVAGAGWAFQWVFTMSGTYEYQCDPHSDIGMTGLIIVNTITTSDLLITEITDPQNSSDAGRYIEIYNSGTQDIDLSTGYALVRWTNGNTSPQLSVDLTGIIPANGFYVVCNSATKFFATYGVEASQSIGTGGPADSNGDDHIALLDPAGIILDIYGTPGQDGTITSGGVSEFEDGRAERKCGTFGEPIFNPLDWNMDHDSGGGDGPQYAPEDFDPFAWICAATPIAGCTDSTASNYDITATTDDGSCTYPSCIDSSLIDVNAICPTVIDPVCGCDSVTYNNSCEAENFGGVTNFTIGVCPIYGCTDSTALNYDVTATMDNGTCIAVIFGCTDTTAANYNSAANTNDSNCCFISGCTYISASNYDSTACYNDGSCIFPVYGCMDMAAMNYDTTADTDNANCIFLADKVDLFFSEYGEGTSNNKYLEIYNSTASPVNLSSYALTRVSNAPTTVGVYEYWVDFDSASIISANDVYIVAHPSADSVILAQADMTYSSLSNGDDGFALVYGGKPSSPVLPGNEYVILDFFGDFLGDPGSGWDVAGITEATMDHVLIRKCSVTQGDTNWITASGVDSLNSEWIVLSNEDWSNIGQHTTPCSVTVINGCTDATACNYDVLSNTDDGSCLYLDIFGICGGNNTIQMAIDSASPGDIINIPLGTYTEFLVINKSITLNAQAGVLLNVAGHTTGILIEDSTSDVTINSLTITGDNLTGSAITVNPGTHNITITNNIISSILLPGGGNASPLS